MNLRNESMQIYFLRSDCIAHYGQYLNQRPTGGGPTGCKPHRWGVPKVGLQKTQIQRIVHFVSPTGLHASLEVPQEILRALPLPGPRKGDPSGGAVENRQ